jgi:hypothetical protein
VTDEATGILTATKYARVARVKRSRTRMLCPQRRYPHYTRETMPFAGITPLAAFLLFAFLAGGRACPCEREMETPTVLPDSLRIVAGVDVITVALGRARRELSMQYSVGVSLEWRLSSQLSISGTPIIGVHDDMRWSDHPIDHIVHSPIVYGLDLSLRMNIQKTAIRGLYVGVTCIYPTKSEIDDMYVYTTKSVIDGIHITAGVVTGISSSMDISVGFRYSWNSKWFWPAAEYGFHAIPLWVSFGFGM